MAVITACKTVAATTVILVATQTERRAMAMVVLRCAVDYTKAQRRKRYLRRRKTVRGTWIGTTPVSTADILTAALAVAVEA
jgi:hypothetical protein